MGSKKSLNVGTYNVWLMPPLVTFFAHRLGIDVSPAKMSRAMRIAEALPQDLDVLVLCEAFCHKATDELCDLLKEKHGLAHRTHILGSKSNLISSGGKFLTGGVVVVCRYPLLTVEEHFYGSICARDDSLADKGVMQVRFLTDNGLVVNLFATHTQAWDEPKCKNARAMQLEKLRGIVQSAKIPTEEIVLIVGDLNVPREVDEYDFMINTLNCINPNPSDISNPSFNHVDNVLASKGPSSGGASTTLDYILISKDHAQPTEAHAEVQRLKSKQPYEYNGKELFDLSDHYPVFGKLHF